jgi:hypothetical protein
VKPCVPVKKRAPTLEALNLDASLSGTIMLVAYSRRVIPDAIKLFACGEIRPETQLELLNLEHKF